MLRLLLRTLRLDLRRTSLSVLAISSAIVLVVVLEGFQVGLYRQIRAYPITLDVPLIATQEGVKNITGARSIIPFEATAQVQQVPGVRAVHPLVGVPLIYAEGAKKTPIYVVAYEGKGGPPSIVRGRAIQAPNELVMDRGLAGKYGRAPGDQVELAGIKFRVAGLSGGSSNMFNPFVFIKLADALRIYASVADKLEHMGADVGLSFLLIETKPNADVAQVRADIERTVASVDVFTPEQLGDNDVAMARQLMGGVMMLLVSVAYIVGVLVIGLTLYSSMIERVRELGVIKAIGARTGYLYRLVLAESLMLVGASLVVGVAAGVAVAELIQWAAPQYAIVPWHAGVLLKTAAAAFVMGGIGALLPLRQVSRVDAALVFKR